MMSGKVNTFENTVWDYGNTILYTLCAENFLHVDDEVIIAKTLFIGRIYAAAIERRKPTEEEKTLNDKFYLEKVVPTFKNSDLDIKIGEIKELPLIEEHILKVLAVHQYLVEILEEITHQKKRSFASKYLHFHLPHSYFIYDTRAVKALNEKIKLVPKKYRMFLKAPDIDLEYARFFFKCLALKDELEIKTGKSLSNRQLDNYLLQV